MRGALILVFDLHDLPGIIPADAGSTREARTGPAAGRDHPRGCGEHSLSAHAACMIWGSSPRMRGAPITGCKAHMEPRIIPADAGSTHEFGQTRAIGKDHPRGCGEHVRKTVSGKMQIGIIPADAGSTGC